MRIACCQHVAFEGPGSIGLWAADRGHAFASVRLDENAPFPEPASYDLLVVMGGPMNVYEEEAHPFLAAEKEGIKKALFAGKFILGVCLGAQLVADALGARIYRNEEPEIGWWPVTLTPEAAGEPLFSGMPQTFKAFHWHGDAFEIPSGATRVAGSEACPNQAFVYEGRVVGAQFHLETTPASMLQLVKNARADIVRDRPFVMSDRRMHELRPNFPIIKEINYAFLDRFAGAFPGSGA